MKKGKGRGRGGSRDPRAGQFPVCEEGQVYARVTKMLGDARVLATGTDGRERTCKIAGRMRKREWVRIGDVVLVSLREFEAEGSKADVVFRYSDLEVRQLSRLGERVHVPNTDADDGEDDLIDFEQHEEVGSDGGGSIDFATV